MLICLVAELVAHSWLLSRESKTWIADGDSNILSKFGYSFSTAIFDFTEISSLAFFFMIFESCEIGIVERNLIEFWSLVPVTTAVSFSISLFAWVSFMDRVLTLNFNFLISESC